MNEIEEAEMPEFDPPNPYIEMQERLAKATSGIEKLIALGLTEEEARAVAGI